ncbi:MAG: hypothetical protein Q9164_001518 [Protoblastenia rupestris]
MDFAQLEARLNLMGSEILSCHQTVQNLNATVLTQSQQIDNLQRHNHHSQGELELKDAELAVYYKHMAKLQERLNKTNEAMGTAQAQIDAANELHKESLQYLERYREQNQALTKQLDEAKEQITLQNQRIQILERLIKDKSQGMLFLTSIVTWPR